MKKITLALSALALSLGLALSPLSATATETSLTTTAQQMPSLIPMLEKVMPSAVSINMEGSTTVNMLRMPRNFQQFFDDDSPFCREGSPLQGPPFCQGGLGGNGGDQQQKFMALGPGAIIDAGKGYVVTSNHVVDSAAAIKVQLSDGRKSDVEMVGKDPRPDIALIQIQNPKNPTVTKMADSDVLRVGDYAVTVGNPFGLGETAASRIISVLEHNSLNAKSYENSTQTNAAINRGNSGGALVNLSGELTGISTVILASDGGNIGIGSVIPSNMVKNLTSQVTEYDQVERGELGIMGAGLDSNLAEATKVDVQRGASVSQALPNSSVAKAGVKVGDMIISLSDRPISSFVALRAQMGIISVGGKLTLDLLHDGKRVNVSLELQQSSQNRANFNTISNNIEGAEVSDEGKDQDVVVNNVKTGTPTTQIDLKKGDVVIGASQQAVKNIAELREALDSKPSVPALNIQCSDNTIYSLIQ